MTALSRAESTAGAERPAAALVLTLEAGDPSQASTTSTYLNVTARHLHDSMKRFIAPLQSVASQQKIEPPPPCNGNSEDAAHVVVN